MPHSIRLSGLAWLLLMPSLAWCASSAEQVQQAHDAIEAWNADLNAVISVDPGALVEAVERDRERDSGQLRSALHGAPVLIKDNIAVMGLPNTAGSLALKSAISKQDAPLVANLREAGLVVLGKPI